MSHRLLELARFGALIAHDNLFDRTVNIDGESTEGHTAVKADGDPFGFRTCPHGDCVLVRSLPDPPRSAGVDIEAIKAREAAASPGPWIVAGSHGCVIGPADEHVICFGHDYDEYGSMDLTNATFIAAARSDIPALLAEIDRLRALCSQKER